MLRCKIRLCANICYRHCMYLKGGCDGVRNESWRRTFTRKYTVQRPTVYTWERIEVRSDSDKMRSKRQVRVEAETSYRIFRNRCRATSLVGIIRNAHTDYQNCRFLRYLFTLHLRLPFPRSDGPVVFSPLKPWNMIRFLAGLYDARFHGIRPRLNVIPFISNRESFKLAKRFAHGQGLD